MHIFVSEFLCGGGWNPGELPLSLAREGGAMLLAVIEDFARVPDVTVSTTWDARIPLPKGNRFPSLNLYLVHSQEEEHRVFKTLAAEADATYVIAPELDFMLETRCRILEERGIVTLNSRAEAIRLCADKLAVFESLRSNGIPTPETFQIGTSPPGFPCIVKLRWGAGSSEMKLLVSRAEWEEWISKADTHRFITQRLIEGTACSMAVFCSEGSVHVALPVARQHLSADGTFQYLGGAITCADHIGAGVLKQIEKFVSQSPGLRGYVGFDFLIATDSDETLILDVNPRLTTSYVGYRQLTTASLADWLLQPARLPIPSFSGSVQFSSNGSLLEYSAS